MVADSHMTGEDFRKRVRILSDSLKQGLCSPDYLLTLYVNHTNLKIELLPPPSRWRVLGRSMGALLVSPSLLPWGKPIVLMIWALVITLFS